MRAPRQPPQTPRRGQPRSLTERQSELLDQLKEMFLQDGFAETTLDELVGELRCSKMTLYSLAPSREQLVLTVLRRFFESAERQVHEAAGRARTAEEKIHAGLNAQTAAMAAMSSICFLDVREFATTNELYEAFSGSCADRLQQLLISLWGASGSAVGRASLLALVVRNTVTSICTGEVNARTGLAREDAIRHLATFLRDLLIQEAPTLRPIK
jgi:AcrR family transcriptional regulator